ncbi:hypothetical protein FXV91_16300 [Methanosarcina sp. DH2]|uniref:hypothetical protein n=1 Tax=Methanosarcina sp. DH2 TaxID=2605639 RepID=UPI001E45F6DE|nr:hypothetical protein [Methanosarcina sp. DH2]MCC4771667.1 hypothetical protein [Methanosarcina sp. DH2]
MQISKRTFQGIIVIIAILVLSILSALVANSGTVNASSMSFQDASEEDTLAKLRQPPVISLTSTKSTIEATDPAIITISIINPSTNDMNFDVDIIIKTPIGIYVTSSTFLSSGSNQYIGHFIVRPGEEKHATIQITSAELGKKEIESQITYYPEGNKDECRTLQQTMSVFAKEKSQEINTTDKSAFQKLWNWIVYALGAIFIGIVVEHISKRINT